MKRNLGIVRTLAAASAIAIVGGTILGLASYSKAKFDLAVASSAPIHTGDLVRLAIEPSRIDVIASRPAPTRTAAHVDEASTPRPQS